jgi:hypothetical protein
MSTSAFCTFGHYADLGYERLQEVDKLVSSSSPRGRAKAMAGPTSQRACHAAMHSSQRSQHQLHAMHVIGGEASLHGRLRRSQDRLKAAAFYWTTLQSSTVYHLGALEAATGMHV